MAQAMAPRQNGSVDNRAQAWLPKLCCTESSTAALLWTLNYFTVSANSIQDLTDAASMMSYRMQHAPTLLYNVSKAWGHTHGGKNK